MERWEEELLEVRSETRERVILIEPLRWMKELRSNHSNSFSVGTQEESGGISGLESRERSWWHLSSSPSAMQVGCRGGSVCGTMRERERDGVVVVLNRKVGWSWREGMFEVGRHAYIVSNFQLNYFYSHAFFKGACTNHPLGINQNRVQHIWFEFLRSQNPKNIKRGRNSSLS